MDTETIEIYMTKARPNSAKQSSQESRTRRISKKLLGSLSKGAEAMATRTSNKLSLDWQNNKFAHGSRFFVHFFAVVGRLRHETARIFSRFGDDVDERQRSSFSFPELR